MTIDYEANNQVEDEEENDKKQITIGEFFAKHWQFCIKVLEIILCAICVSLCYKPFFDVREKHYTYIILTTFQEFILINVVLLITRMLGEKTNYKNVTLFAFLGAAMHLMSAILLSFIKEDSHAIPNFRPPHQHLTVFLIVGCVVAVINTIVFLIDGFFTFIRKQDF